MSSQPATQTGASPPAKPARKYYMDPLRVKMAVGNLVKPTNPLLQYIPHCKNIDEFNEFTKTETYRKLMDFRNPLCEPKIDPEFRPLYDSVQARRVKFMENNLPLYAKLPAQRAWYFGTWAILVGTSCYLFPQIIQFIKEH